MFAEPSPDRVTADSDIDIEVGIGDLVGTIRHRLLVNRWVDPDEVTPLLPDGVRPRVGSNGGVVVGCCLIAIDSIRPWPMPAAIGPSVKAAAHRISVETGPKSNPTSAVYVPLRHTDSRATVAVGGRIFPGVHERSDVSVSESGDEISWRLQPVAGDGDQSFAIAARASTAKATVADSEEADIVIGTFLGLSPDHRGRLEAADMQPFDLRSESVELADLSSPFLEGFASAQEAETLLMTDVGVTWRRASAHPSDER